MHECGRSVNFLHERTFSEAILSHSSYRWSMSLRPSLDFPEGENSTCGSGRLMLVELIL